ncbi:GNAT family protein [Gorillibacterium sp. CAU 1737]|uniref:GNAT family N-acetyltransferase n=1 Tax=Gorillibacterium sp. CAU 1737 TaxID=3140362 RepID=UPI00326068EB
MLKGPRIYLRPFQIDDAGASLRLHSDNRDFFEKYSSTRTRDFYTIEGQVDRIKGYNESMQKDNAYEFGIFRNDDHALIGSINLFHVMRGALQSAIVGYVLDKSQNGKGYTTEAVQLIVNYGFNELTLHRIEAGVMPHHLASIRVLEKAGFHKEGIAQKNVKINGKWEDHQVLAILNPND